ncbi:MOSC domain-containing protein [Bacillus sp. 165]|uniref:MOSC domain-containing protein n=1 Tax=Bacillus sp. 165 TaxID=1529117 RepID=UPI001ADC5A69|nr:MOSC domain-containing protein [Bacillus sp. 165]MBO9128957.1 MOSC domain-containing protein [Bacillus sp. 165]
MRILSLNVGKPVRIEYGGKDIETGIYKKPVDDVLFLSKLNFEGDGQADLVHHGGEDKAVCVYPYEHYAYWIEKYNIPLEYGAFGENLTTKGMTEEDICIGDTFQLGDAVVQVSQPRQPCFKIAKKHNIKEFPVMIQNTGFSGYYARVLQEGNVQPTCTMELISRHPERISLSFANHTMYHDKTNKEAMLQIVAVEELAESWRNQFAKYLQKL